MTNAEKLVEREARYFVEMCWGEAASDPARQGSSGPRMETKTLVEEVGAMKRRKPRRSSARSEHRLRESGVVGSNPTVQTESGGRVATGSVGPMSTGPGGEQAARTGSQQREEMPAGSQQEPGHQRSAQGQPGVYRESAPTAEGSPPDSTKGSWPDGISDGLTLPCLACGMVPAFDHTVADDFWQRVVPPEWRLGVVCLPCLDGMATEAGEDVSLALVRVQFCGRGKTVVLRPQRAYRHGAATDD